MATKMVTAKMELVPEGTPNSQRVAVIEDVELIGMRYAKIPDPADDELRVKITYVGICGSDLETYRGTRAPEFASIPARLGHEVAGVIDKIGKTVVGLNVGDRITCRYVWGAFAEYIVCKPFNVKVLPPTFPMLETSLIGKLFFPDQLALY
jgi:threonine dehydrogenase-like Zn-dependent dehydrogenase